MVVSGRNLSLLGRAALSNAGGVRASQRPAPDPVEPTDPLKDPTSAEYRDLPSRQRRAAPAPTAPAAQDRPDPFQRAGAIVTKGSVADDDRVADKARPALAAYRNIAASGASHGVLNGRLDVIA